MAASGVCGAADYEVDDAGSEGGDGGSSGSRRDSELAGEGRSAGTAATAAAALSRPTERLPLSVAGRATDGAERGVRVAEGRPETGRGWKSERAAGLGRWRGRGRRVVRRR